MLRGKKRVASLTLMVLLLLSIACGGGDASEETTGTTSSSTSVASTETTTSSDSTTTEAEDSTAAEETAAADDFSNIPDGTMIEGGAIILGGVKYGGVVNGYGEEPQYGGVAVFSHRRDLPSSDPMFSGTISLHNVGGAIWGRGNLLRVKRENNFEVEGYLAQSWEVSDDFKTWDFKLHPNILWHDGTPFTADDVVYWVNLANDPPEGRRTSTWAVTLFGDMASVEAVDKLTVRFNLNNPAPNWPEALSTRGAVITHPKHLTQPELDAGNARVQPNQHNWVALGPYKFDSYDKGAVVKVRRNEDYFEKDAAGRTLPFMDGIDFPIMRDYGAMTSAFRAGRLDGTSRGAGFGVLPPHVDAIKKDLGDKAWIGRVLYVGWGQSPNTLKEPWSDVNLRKALSLFVDRQKISILSLGGASVPGAIWTPGSGWANQDVPVWPGMNPATKEEDRAAGIKLLKDGGWYGMKTELLCRDLYLYLCEAFDAQMRDAGFDNFLKMTDVNQLSELQASGDYTMLFQSNTGAMPSAKRGSFCSHTCNPRYSNHDDPKIDELFDKVISTADPAARNAMLQELERYMMHPDEMVYRDSWFHEVISLAYRARIKGLPVPHMNVHDNTDHATTWIDQSMPR